MTDISQPDFVTMANALATVAEQVSRIQNLPCVQHRDDLVAAFQSLEARMDGIEARIDHLEKEKGRISEPAEQLAGEMRQWMQDMGQWMKKMGYCMEKMDQLEHRLGTMETPVAPGKAKNTTLSTGKAATDAKRNYPTKN